MIQHRISARSVSVLMDGTFRTVSNQAANYDAIVALLKTGADNILDELRELINVATFVNKITSGRVVISEEGVFFEGEQLSGYMATRILQHLHSGVDLQPFAAFIDNVMDNPNTEVRKDLFKWVEVGDMAFTADGCFLAYKYVQSDYFSSYSGKNGRVFHGLGEFVTMPRSECNPSRDDTCSTGLHFCSYGYLGGYTPNRRIILVKVHPTNVTAIPTDYSLQKGRACAYTVVAELPHAEVTDILRGRAVIRSFTEFSFGEEIQKGDDALLNEQVLVDDFEDDDFDDLDNLDDFDDFDEIDDEFDDEDDGIEDFDERSGYRDFGDEINFGGKPTVSEAIDEIEETFDKVEAKEKVKKSKKGKKTTQFVRNGVTFKAARISKVVAKLGQRGAAKELDVPRSTLQTWLAAING